MPGLLSWVMTVIHGSKFEASDVFPGPGSNIRHPLSVFPSLHRVLRDQFPGFISTMRVLRLPAAHPAALRCLRLAVPLRSLVVFAPRRTSEPPRPLRCSSVALDISKAKAPTKGLSKLNSMAFGLAVYASQCELPTPHARLASGLWSGAIGRDFHPQCSYEIFQSYILTSHPPFPSFAWHNEIDRRMFAAHAVVLKWDWEGGIRPS